MMGSVYEAAMEWLASPSSQTAMREGVAGGLEAAATTLVITAVLELVALDTVRMIHQKQPGGPALYRQSIAVNFFNHFVLGIPVYSLAVLLFCRTTDEDDQQGGLLATVLRILGIIFIHDILYYEAHKTMHSGPGWYRFHKFHHRFRNFIPPSSANAVSIVEYLLAYVIPFAMAAFLIHPSEAEFRITVNIVSVANLLIHTPAYDPVSKYLEAVYLVSTRNHSDHHRKLTMNYAAPIFNLDRLLDELIGSDSGGDGGGSKATAAGVAS
jgi:sterol desaturase/sphingolipid hydroxylase (fatty acid hydroxylase superfamily)